LRGDFYFSIGILSRYYHMHPDSSPIIFRGAE
jgi:hypothetical protein